MSASNVLRLIAAAMTINKEQLDLTSSQILAIRPLVTDTGALHVGDGTYDMDVKVYLGSTTEYALFDVGNSCLDLHCPLTITGDLTVTGKTTLNDTVVTAEHGAGAIGTGVAPVTSRRIENGTIITEIKIDLQGLASKDTANDVIGLSTGGNAYIGRNVVATNGVIYKIELICLETPAGGDNDVNLVANSSGTLAYDGAGGTTYGVDGGDAVAGQVVQNLVQGLTANHYFYLTAGTGDTAAAYTAGQFLVRLYGHPVLT